MGTRSTVGYNARCTVRGPVGGDTVEEAFKMLDGRLPSNHDDRRWAKAQLRKYAKQVRKNVPPKQRNSVQRQLIRQVELYV